MRFSRLALKVVSVAYVATVSFPLRAEFVSASLDQNPGIQQQQPANQSSALSLSGTVLREDQTTPVAGVRLQLRNLDTGAIVGKTTSDGSGAYSFPVSEAGRYLVEAVDKDGVRAVSQPVTITNTPITTNLIQPMGKGPAAFLTSAAFLVASAATSAGIAALVLGVVASESPER